MFRSVLAIALLAAPAAAAAAQDKEMGDWALARMPNGCMVQAVSPQGTMLSIWGFAGQEKLGFLLQNREWSALRDGERYALDLEFVGVKAVPVEATAREHIDSDGPGFFFTFDPGGPDARAFLDALASAADMKISQGGRAMDSLPLEGSRGAMAALARCLSEQWSGGEAPAAEPDAEQAKEEAVPL